MRRNGLLVIIAVVTCFAPLRAHIAHENPARRGVQPEQHHLSPEVKVSLSASGTVTREEFSGARSSLMRRDLNYDETIQDEDAGADAGDPDSDAESDEAEDNDDAKEPAACDSGGETTYRSPRSFQVEAPTQVPFTLSLRMRWTGDSPPDLTPNPACVICWTIDPDTTPSTNKEQFYQGLDGQPPRIALMRMGNVLNYEEYGADGGTGTVNLFTSAKQLNDGEYHEVVVVRGESRITLWIDGQPDSFISRQAKGNNFQNADLPVGKPNAITGKASTSNEYLRKQVKNTASYNKVDPNNGKWALKGEVTNVRLYYTELSANDFPNSKTSCEATTTQAPVTCHTSCDRCDGASEEDCLSCKARRFLHDRKCLEQCPDGTFGDSDSKACTQCHDSCGSCSGSGEADCQSCDSQDNFLHNGRCLTACPPQFFADAKRVCVKLAGSVVALKTTGKGGTFFVYSNSTSCVKLVPLDDKEKENPKKVSDEAKMWMISDTGNGETSLRNVRTGMALHMLAKPRSQTKESGCSETLSSCAVARPPTPVLGQDELWTDNEWATSKCEKSAFTVTPAGPSTIGLSIGKRYLRFHKEAVMMSDEVDASEPKLDKSMRFEPVVVLPAVASELRTRGRCKQMITQSLQCSAAAGGQAIDAFADFTEQSPDTSKPPGCYYYQHEISAPKGSGDQYSDLPTKVSRLALNLLSSDTEADYSAFADCSSKMPCLCKKQ